MCPHRSEFNTYIRFHPPKHLPDEERSFSRNVASSKNMIQDKINCSFESIQHTESTDLNIFRIQAIVVSFLGNSGKSVEINNGNHALHAGGIINSSLEHRNKLGNAFNTARMYKPTNQERLPCKLFLVSIKKDNWIAIIHFYNE